ncbi:MAG: sialidase family protein [Longimicrobiales bacterium]
MKAPSLCHSLRSWARLLRARAGRAGRAARARNYRNSYRLGFTLVAVLTACGPAGPRVDVVDVPSVAGARETADPAIARDPANGDWLLSWVAGDSSGYHLYFARSGDGGASWSAPVRVTDRAHDIKPHAEASARMVAVNGAIALFWPNNIEVPGRRFPASHMRFSRSTDGGRSWTSAITLNDDTASALAGHTFHGATARGDTMIVAWLDSRTGAQPAHGDTAVHHDGDATIYTAVSADRGVSWAAQNGVYWGNACPCCRVSLASAPDGRVLAAWRGHFEGSVRDPVVATLSPARGAPTRVRADGWVFQGCPHTGPALAIDDTGSLHVAWFTGKEGGAGVFYARTSGASSAFGTALPLLTAESLPAAHPAITMTRAGAVIAMNLDPNGRRALTIATVREGTATTHVVPNTEGADHPHLIALPDGNALVAWTEKMAGAVRIRLARVVAGE